MKKYFFFLLLLLPFCAFAQLYDNTWITGDSYANNPPYNGNMVVQYNAGGQPVGTFQLLDMAFWFTGATISDSSGNLQFYTNGLWIANSNHDTLAGGGAIGRTPLNDTLRNQYKQDAGALDGAVILPTHSATFSHWVVHQAFANDSFSATGLDYYTKLFLTKVDISQQNGLGAVVQQDIVPITDSLSGQAMAVCRHANGDDWWVVVGGIQDSVLYSVHLRSATGDYVVYKQTFNHPWLKQYSARYHFDRPFRFNATGTRLYAGSYLHPITEWRPVIDEQKIFEFGFNRCTGELTYHQQLNMEPYFQAHINGMQENYDWTYFEISPNAQYLYFPVKDTLFQMEIQTQQVQVAGYGKGGSYGLGGMFHAPNGTMYIKDGARELIPIYNPNSPGLSCNMDTANAILLPLEFAVTPNFPNYRLGPLPPGACEEVSVEPAVPLGSGAGLKVWPNPASSAPSAGSETGLITVELPAQTSGTLQLISATGVVLNSLPFSGQQVEIPLAGIPAGVYTVRVHTREGAMHTAKLVVLP